MGHATELFHVEQSSSAALEGEPSSISDCGVKLFHVEQFWEGQHRVLATSLPNASNRPGFLRRELHQDFSTWNNLDDEGGGTSRSSRVARLDYCEREHPDSWLRPGNLTALANIVPRGTICSPRSTVRCAMGSQTRECCLHCSTWNNFRRFSPAPGEMSEQCWLIFVLDCSTWNNLGAGGR